MEEQKTKAVDEDWLEHRMQQLDSLATEIKQAEQELTESREAQQLKAEQLERKRARLMAKQARLEQERELLDSRRQHTRTQRRRIAGWLNAERKALQLERAEFQQESKRLRKQLERKLARLDQEAKRMSQSDQAEDGDSKDRSQAPLDTERVQWVAERSFLESRIEELEQQLMEVRQSSAAAAQAKDDSADRGDDLQRRYEIAMHDVRELKQRNAELEESFASAPADVPHATTAVPGENWETTKKRLLAELDEDQPPAKQLTAEDRLTAEGAIRITDSIVAQRDAEIADLKIQLAQLQMNQNNPIYNPQSAADEVLEQDELVRHERERLEALKNEMKEKLRSAEVEFSVQRASIARQRIELQEKARVLDTEKKNLELQRGSGGSADKQKKQSGRWLERLGLKEADE